MGAYALGYKPLKNFIDGGYRDDVRKYRHFPLPSLVDPITLRWKYIKKNIAKNVYSKGVAKANEWLKNHKFGTYEYTKAFSTSKNNMWDDLPKSLTDSLMRHPIQD